MKFNRFTFFSKLLSQKTRNTKNFINTSYIEHIRSINKWLNKYSSDKGIYISNKQRREFPEVTGYWIETLLKWSYVEKASKWFNWLISIQNIDGGWPEPYTNGPSVLFDSGQIIRGIKCYSEINNVDVTKISKNFLSYFLKVKEKHFTIKTASIKSIGWHLNHLQTAWIVHKNWPGLISLKWLKLKLSKSLKIWKVGYQLSHYDIYALEAMYELGIFPNKLKKYIRYFDKKVRRLNYVPCDRNNNAPCYTATAQLGVLYYKMGRKKDGDRLLFTMLDHLNVRRGNWTGSGKGGNYGPKEELSWGLKYFLDLLYYHYTSSFDLDPKIPINLSNIITHKVNIIKT